MCGWWGGAKSDNLMCGQVRDVWFLFQQVQMNQIGCHGFSGTAALVINAVDAVRLLEIKWVYFVSCPGWLMCKD